MAFVYIFLLAVPLTSASIFDYEGFSSCGVDGWYCTTKTVIFDCSRNLNQVSRGRVWVWTARIPNHATKFLIQNCDHLQLHTDCTRGGRSTWVEELYLKNITKLQFLKPERTGLYLHDNEQISQLPAIVHMENIGSVSFYNKLFSKATDECKNHEIELKKLQLENVTVDFLEADSFANTTMTEVVWRNVTLKIVEPNQMKAKESILLENSHIRALETHSLQLEAEDVRLFGNKLGTIYAKGITVKARSFGFDRNSVDAVSSQGFVALCSHVDITNNIFHRISSSAFERISPSYLKDEKIATKLTYKFNGNSIYAMSAMSLHNDWESYNSTCAEIAVDRNQIECSCESVNWLKTASGFYKKFVDSDNTCSNLKGSLRSILSSICNNGTDAVKFPTLNVTEEASNFGPTVATVNNSEYAILEFERDVELEDMPRRSRDPIVQTPSTREKSYYLDQSKLNPPEPENDTTIWVIGFGILLIIDLIIGAGLLMWCMKRRKKVHIQSACKYDKSLDTDNLILNVTSDSLHTQCQNIMFQN